MEQWKIHRDRQRAEKPCCRRAAQTEYYAVLELPECIRRDLCAACFTRLEQSQDGTPIHWRARRRIGKSHGPVLDLASLRQLFDRLGESADENAQGLRYFVALLLLRKRMLKVVEGNGAAAEAADLVVIDPKIEGMEPVLLFAPELDDERLGRLKDDLLGALAEDE